MKKTILLYSIIGLMLSLGASAQTDRLSSVNRDYANFSYQDSAEELLKLVQKGEKSKKIYDKLANSYYYIGDMSNASKWYGSSLETFDDKDREIAFRYAQSLKRSGNIDGSDKIMKQFVKDFPADSRAIKYAKAGDYMGKINSISREMKIENIDYNSKVSDFGTAFYKEGIVFASAQGGGRKYNWTNQPFLDLFYADDDTGELEEFSSQVNSKFHESTPVFTKDGETMYFTRNNFIKGKAGKDSRDVILLKIYRARLVNGKWTDITPLPFNSDEYNVSHPTLNKEENKMYFASDMPGTMGDSDIFVVDLFMDDTFGVPQNMGAVINTAGKESFPYISNQEILYFASNGQPGLGGLDVYEFDLKSQNAIVRNMGRPINSVSDDFCYVVSESKNTGYFSSNREGGKGDDDIYRFRAQDICEQSIFGTVVDSNSNEIISDALVSIRNRKGELIASTNSDIEGKVSFLMPCADAEFQVETSKEGYVMSESKFQTKDKDGEIQLDLKLSPVIDESLADLNNAANKDKLVDLSDTLNLNPLYFDLDQSVITQQAEIELTKVITYMKIYKKINIDVRSHTDSRASDSYNMALSERRAQATIQYLITIGGIDKSRVTGRGYGETKLVNKCSNGVKCSEQEHAKNRRSEFIVVK